MGGCPPTKMAARCRRRCLFFRFVSVDSYLSCLHNARTFGPSGRIQLLSILELHENWYSTVFNQKLRLVIGTVSVCLSISRSLFLSLSIFLSLSFSSSLSPFLSPSLHIHPHVHAPAHLHTPTHTPTHTSTHTYLHTHTHTHTHTHRHTHTHTIPHADISLAILFNGGLHDLDTFSVQRDSCCFVLFLLQS